MLFGLRWKKCQKLDVLFILSMLHPRHGSSIKSCMLILKDMLTVAGPILLVFYKLMITKFDFVKNIPGDRYLCAQASRLQQMSQSVSSLN
jgi:hypothetical protein